MADKKELVVRKNDDDLPILPRQIRSHFPYANREELRYLATLYTGTKERPSFTEWLESHQQNELFEKTRQANYWVDKFNKDLKEKDDKISSGELDEEEERILQRKIDKQRKIADRITEQYLSLTRELNKLIQNNLMRDSPRKTENLNVQVTPGDVANLINNAKNTINTTTRE